MLLAIYLSLTGCAICIFASDPESESDIRIPNMRGICHQRVSSLIVLLPFENMYYDSIIKYLCFDIPFYAKCSPAFPNIDEFEVAEDSQD